MDYTTLSLHECFDLTLKEMGHEDTHTIAIGQLVDLVASKYLAQEDATRMAQIIYHHGAENLHYNEDWDEDEEYDEPDYDECGFNPYLGCWDFDC